MNCRRVQHHLSLAEDGEEVLHDASDVERHLEDCAACRTFSVATFEISRRYRNECRRGIAALRALEGIPSGNCSRIPRILISAGVMAAILLGALFRGTVETPIRTRPQVSLVRSKGPALDVPEAEPRVSGTVAFLEPLTLPTLSGTRLISVSSTELPVELWGSDPAEAGEPALPSWTVAHLDLGAPR